MKRKRLATNLVDGEFCSEATAHGVTNPALTNGDNYVLDWLELLPNGPAFGALPRISEGCKPVM